MRTPPPVLPSEDETPGYKSTWMDRNGPDAGLKIRTFRYSIIVFPLALALWSTLITRKFGMTGLKATVLILFAAVMTTVLAYVAGLASANSAGAVARAYTLPSGSSTPYEEQFSYQDALAARGDVAGALESFEAVIAERPGDAAPRLKAADLYARRGKDPRRAAVLFREVRDLPGATRRDALYAASRLVDLYDGPLEEPGRALVELRRMIELYPGTDVAAGARTAIARIKSQRAAEQGEG